MHLGTHPSGFRTAEAKVGCRRSRSSFQDTHQDDNQGREAAARIVDGAGCARGAEQRRIEGAVGRGDRKALSAPTQSDPAPARRRTVANTHAGSEHSVDSRAPRSTFPRVSTEAPMRLPLCLVTLLVSALSTLPQPAVAQPVASPAIQSVTLQPDTGVLTITRTGLGADLMVTVDGQPVTVLPGATATRVEVQPPATVLTTPGTYRLTVADPVHRVGDGFVVPSQGSVAGGVIEAGRTRFRAAT
jgi:hypothetical protein